MSITVTILINGQPIYTRSARNVSQSGTKDDEISMYKVDTGEVIAHKRKDGAVKLAKKMLDTIREV